MSQLEAIRALAAQEAEESGVDLNVAVASGGGGRLLPEGYAFGRIVEYIEYGAQPQEYQGKAKPAELEFSLGVALWGTAPNGDTYHNAEDGKPYIQRTWRKALHRNDKAGAFKLFKSLNWKGTAKNFAQLIGEPILVKIVHVDKVKGDPSKGKKHKIDEAGFLPPLDPVTRAPYQIPEAPDEAYRAFLWSRPTKAAWDALFIDGQFDGKSKNYIQETILAAEDFQGSPLQLLLAGAQAGGITALPASPNVAVPTAPVQVAAPLAQPAASTAVAPVAVPSVSTPTPAPVVAAIAPAPVGVRVPVMPVVPTPVAPSSPVLPA
jgi:hypothetical protein